MGETYYEVLGVDPDADTEEIRDAFRDRVLETHPDHNDAEDASERFALVTEAESVLTDETERARYDRLGHDAYRRWGTQFAGGDGRGPSTGDESTTGSRAESGGARSRTGGSDSRTRSSTSGASGTVGSTPGTSGTAGSTSGTTESGSSTSGSTVGGGGADSGSSGSGGASHHARQRYRRRAATASETDWWFGQDTEPSYTSGSDSDQRADSDSASGTADRSGAGFAVHGWTDEVELDSPFRSLTERTAVLLGSLWLLYPLLVYSSLSPAFPTLINATVTVCTLVLVGYLLTWPRVAVATFGSWSLLSPVLVPAATGAELVSLVGAVVSAAFWVPFAIATANWWVLRH